MNQIPHLVIDDPCAELQNHIFKDYPEITITAAQAVTGSTFENCGQITIEDQTITECKFINIDTLYVTNADVENCEFHKISCDQHTVICIEDGNISHCLFKDIELRNEAWLGDAVGDVLVDYCRFENISTDREDGELFHCEEERGFLFKRTKCFDVVDDRTCTGLEDICIV